MPAAWGQSPFVWAGRTKHRLHVIHLLTFEKQTLVSCTVHPQGMIFPLAICLPKQRSCSMTQHWCAPDAAEIPKKGKVASIRSDIFQIYIWTDDTEHEAFNYILFISFYKLVATESVGSSVKLYQIYHKLWYVFQMYFNKTDCSVDWCD